MAGVSDEHGRRADVGPEPRLSDELPDELILQAVRYDRRREGPPRRRCAFSLGRPVGNPRGVMRKLHGAEVGVVTERDGRLRAGRQRAHRIEMPIDEQDGVFINNPCSDHQSTMYVGI